MLYRLEKEEGVSLMMESSKWKATNQSMEDYSDWLDTFTYLRDEASVVALRPLDEMIEFHYLGNPDSSVKQWIKSMKGLLEFVAVPVCTYITDRDQRLINLLVKRFGFTSECKGIDTASGEKRYLLTK